MTRGYFEIGVFRSKSEANVGTLWRSAYQLGAAGIFTIGKRFPQQCTDTLKTHRHIPLREFSCLAEFVCAMPHSCALVAIEIGGKPIESFKHPERACYLLGAEDHGLPQSVLDRCHLSIALPCVRTPSFNVAVAGSIVMYDRLIKEQQVKP